MMRFAGRTHVLLLALFAVACGPEASTDKDVLDTDAVMPESPSDSDTQEDAAGDTDAPDTDVFDTEVDTGGPELEDDGPTGWLTVDVGSNADFHAVHFVDEMTGWIVGAIHMGFAPPQGITLKTTDGGQTWTEQSPGVSAYHHVYFRDAQTGWIAGGGWMGNGLGDQGFVHSTTDGGQTWSEMMYPFAALQSVHVAPDDAVWAVGDRAAIMRSGQLVEGFPTAPRDLRDVAFADADIGWVLARTTSAPVFNAAFRTLDGGETWEQLPWGLLGISAGQFMEAADFVDSTYGLVVGRHGLILGVDPSGGVLVEFETGTTEHLNDVQVLGDTAAWVVGDAGTILSMTDDTDTPWVLQDSGTTADLRDVHFVDEDHGWAVGFGGVVLKTTDGGGR